MAFGKRNTRDEITMEIDPSMDIIIEQAPGSNSFLAMRNICWNGSGAYRLDIRRWYTDSDGNENPGKGFSFTTESGPDNLAVSLVKNNYGNTEQILNAIKNRDDFEYSINIVLNRGANNKKPLYDPKSILV